MDNKKSERGHQTTSRQTSLTEAAIGKFVGPDPIGDHRTKRLSSSGSEKFSGTFNGATSGLSPNEKASDQGDTNATKPNARKVSGGFFPPTVPESIRSNR